MTEYDKDIEIVQLKARIKELETAIDGLANASIAVIKYFAEKR